MPATAGRVRMPANNRVHSSAALQTHGIWQTTIRYDPYAPNKDDSKNSSNQMPATAEPEGENAYASFQGLLALARITGSNADEARGSCRKCGRVGHLTFQCKNLVSLKESKEKDSEAIQAAVLNGLDKLKGGKSNRKEGVESEEEEEEEEESESSDSDVDPMIERIIAERSGKKVSSKGTKSSKKKKRDESDSDSGEKKKRGRSRKRSGRKRGSSDSDDENESTRKRRKEKRRKRDESSDEDDDDDEHRLHRKRKSRKEKRRRRSHRSSYDSESSDASDDSGNRRRRRSHRDESPSDSDVSGSDDSRVGRGAKRSEKRSRKRHHGHDNK